MENYREICESVNEQSLAELYTEYESFVAKGRACFNDDRVYFKVFDPTLELEVGDVFVLRFCCSYVYGQLASFVDNIGEFLVLKGGMLPKEQRVLKFSKDALILFENSIHKDKWGTLLVKEPYFLARLISLCGSGAKVISSVNRNMSEDFYMALQLDLFECLVRCKVVTKSAIDEYGADFVYELQFFDVDSEVKEILDSLREA